MKFIFSASVALTTGWLETREHLGVLETGRGPPRWPLIGPGCNQDPPSEGQPEPFLSLEDGALRRPGWGREGQVGCHRASAILIPRWPCWPGEAKATSCRPCPLKAHLYLHTLAIYKGRLHIVSSQKSEPALGPAVKGPAQNEHAGPLVQTLLRMSRC